MTPSQEVVKLTPAQALAAEVRSPKFQDEVALALPEGTPPARFVRVAVTALLETPDLAAADRLSVFTALLKAAADGLLPDGREAALVVFNDKTKGKIAAYMPMVGGFRKIAAEHGWTLEARAVFDGDDFDYAFGAEPFVTHRPAPLAATVGDLVAAYAVGTELETGRKLLDVMTAAEIAKVRGKSKRAEIWAEWPEHMAAKSVARRLFKTLPLGDRDRVRRVLDADELTPAAAEAIVYGAEARGGERQHGADLEPPAEARPHDPPAAPRPFTGDEPAAREVRVEKAELERADLEAFVFGEGWEGTRYHGQTLADVFEAGDVEYLDWIVAAVTDESLKAAAAKALEALR